jgi:hypothetical protein
MPTRLTKKDADALDDMLRYDPDLPIDLLYDLFPCTARTIYDHKRKLKKEGIHRIQPVNLRGRPRLVTKEEQIILPTAN